MPTYRLLSGSMYRWVNGGRVHQTAGDLIADLSPAEINTHAHRLEFVSAEPFKTTRSTPPLAPAELRNGDVDQGGDQSPPEAGGDAIADAGSVADVDESVGDSEAEDYDWTEILAGNVASIREYIAETLDEVGMVQSLAAAEKAGQARKSVLLAAVARVKALQLQEEEE